MESALEVLSRAATMINDRNDYKPLKNKPFIINPWSWVESSKVHKETPTLKWKQERRNSREYAQRKLPSHINTAKKNKDLPREDQEKESNLTPIDMRTIKARTPPPYREPLPGSKYASLSRPSVITLAPSVRKRKEEMRFSGEISNSEIDISKTTNSVSMCDPVIDEHFRRSLGPNYVEICANKTPKNLVKEECYNVIPEDKTLIEKCQIKHLIKKSINNSPNNDESKSRTIMLTIQDSVDDHFAKALGDTWKELQSNKKNK